METKRPTSSQNSSEKPSTSSTETMMEGEVPKRMMAVAPLMAIRLKWTAASSHYARRAMWDLADQLRGAELTALRPLCWTVHWTVWQGKSESKLNASSTSYGCTLWVHPASPD